MSKHDMIGKPAVILLPDGTRRGTILREGGELETKYGRIRHDDILRAGWGGEVKTSAGHTVVVIKPTIIDLIDLFFERTSQVIYPRDASWMIAMSGIRAGSRVGEAGTGSGFLTCMLAHTVYPDGKVYTFEIRDDMIKTARRNLSLTEYASIVEMYRHDVRTGIPVGELDAFFLDMPDPWSVLEHVHSSLKSNGCILIFVPTVNQVIKVLRHIKETGLFTGVRVMETSVREYRCNPEALRPESVQVVHMGYIVFARKNLIKASKAECLKP